MREWGTDDFGCHRWDITTPTHEFQSKVILAVLNVSYLGDFEREIDEILQGLLDTVHFVS